MNKLSPVILNYQSVLTTQQLADVYKIDVNKHLLILKKYQLHMELEGF